MGSGTTSPGTGTGPGGGNTNKRSVIKTMKWFPKSDGSGLNLEIHIPILSVFDENGIEMEPYVTVEDEDIPVTFDFVEVKIGNKIYIGAVNVKV